MGHCVFYTRRLLKFLCLLFLCLPYCQIPNKIRLSRRNKEIILFFMYKYFLYRINISIFVKNNQLCKQSTFIK